MFVGLLCVLIGDVCVVLLGEGLYGVYELFEFCNELFVWLVEYLGFGVIVLEFGFLLGLLVDVYVCGGVGEVEVVVVCGIILGLYGFFG